MQHNTSLIFTNAKDSLQRNSTIYYPAWPVSTYRCFHPCLSGCCTKLFATLAVRICRYRRKEWLVGKLVRAKAVFLKAFARQEPLMTWTYACSSFLLLFPGCPTTIAIASIDIVKILVASCVNDQNTAPNIGVLCNIRIGMLSSTSICKYLHVDAKKKHIDIDYVRELPPSPIDRSGLLSTCRCLYLYVDAILPSPPYSSSTSRTSIRSCSPMLKATSFLATKSLLFRSHFAPGFLSCI